MNDKINIDLGKVQKTLLIPLLGHALEFASPHPLVKDRYAYEIVQRLNYDFGPELKQMPMPIMINSAIRAHHLDCALRDLLGTYPDATIVNIGAGLDTTFHRVDNGRVFWYDLDLPDTIALRRQLIPEGDRNRCIAKSVFDKSWFKDITERLSKVFFMATGVFIYLKNDDLRQLFLGLAANFPGSDIMFDVYSKKFLWLRNHALENSREKSDLLMPMIWGVNSGKAIARWSVRITIVDEFSFYSRINLEEYWDKKYLSSLRLLKFFRAIKMLHCRFA